MASTHISVCMATYNGSLFVEKQLRSILPQLGIDDEIVIVDDASKDDTVAVVEKLADLRIRLLRNNSNQGVLRTFERALLQARGEIIFLSDQDDLWSPDKVSQFLHTFEQDSEITLALSDGRVVDGEGNLLQPSWTDGRQFIPGLLANLLKNRYLGCVMAFRSEVLRYCLPFPAGAPMHDMWIGCVNQMFGKASFIDKKLVDYRKHGGNVTTGRHASIVQMIMWRWRLASNLLNRYLRVRFGAHQPASARPQLG